MIEQNIPYKEKDIRYLALYLGLNKKEVFRFNSLVSILFLVISELILFLFEEGKNLYLYLIPLILTIILFLTISFDKKYKSRRKTYFNNVYKKYLDTNIEYKDYDMFIVGIIPNKLNKLTTNTCLLLTNGYKFIIKEDIFKYSNYSFDSNKVLKVLTDRNLTNKNTYQFLITDIKSFKLNGKIIENSNIDSATFENKEFDTMTIMLKDMTEINMSTNMYEYFKALNSFVEIKNEE